MITDIVSALESATSLKAYPFWTDELKECIVYEWTPRSDDGSKQNAQMMIRIKTKTMASSAWATNGRMAPGASRTEAAPSRTRQQASSTTSCTSTSSTGRTFKEDIICQIKSYWAAESCTSIP